MQHIKFHTFSKAFFFHQKIIDKKILLLNADNQVLKGDRVKLVKKIV